MAELNALLDEYQERFDDQFPMMACLSDDIDEIKDKIRKCLETGKKFKYNEKRFC